MDKDSDVVQDPREGPVGSSAFWFEDGNIILRAGEASFRVHSSVLSRNSAFFRDLFSLPQAAQAAPELLDGCPVVLLHEIPGDVVMLLTAVYDRAQCVHHTDQGAKGRC